MTNLAKGSRMVPGLEFDSAILSSGNHIFELECLQLNKGYDGTCFWIEVYELKSYFNEHLLLNIPTAILDMD